MSNFPNPFLNEPNYNSPSNPNQAKSPGFLMMTRPPSACTIGQNGQGRSMGRSSYKSNNYMGQRRSPYYNSDNSFPNEMQRQGYYRGAPNNRSNGTPPYNYHNRSQNHNSSFESPGNNYYKNQNHSNSPRFHSTPSNTRGWHGRSKGRGPHTRGSFMKSGFTSVHKTPLKDIPVDKFISENMFKDPWGELTSKYECESASKLSGGGCSDSSSYSSVKQRLSSADSESSFSSFNKVNTTCQDTTSVSIPSLEISNSEADQDISLEKD